MGCILSYSRHYADVAEMSNTKVVDEALGEVGLLKSVTNHKDMFYHCGWAKYDLAIIPLFWYIGVSFWNNGKFGWNSFLVLTKNKSGRLGLANANPQD